MTLTVEQRVKIAGNIKVLQSEIAEREEAIDNLKAKLAEDLGIGEFAEGDFLVTVYQSKAFNAKLAEQTLSPERWEAISTPTRVTTAAQAKKVLTEEEFASVQKASDKTSVKVEMRED